MGHEFYKKVACEIRGLFLNELFEYMQSLGILFLLTDFKHLWFCLLPGLFNMLPSVGVLANRDTLVHNNINGKEPHDTLYWLCRLAVRTIIL